MSLVVRRAVKDDAGRVAELAVKLAEQHHEYDSRRFALLYDERDAKGFYSKQVGSSDSAVLVAENDGEVIGFAFIEYEDINYSDLLEKAAWLHDIYIEESARELKVGKLLIAEVVKAAKELGANKLMLSVATKNKFAKDFFERNGFAETMVERMLDLT